MKSVLTWAAALSVLASASVASAQTTTSPPPAPPAASRPGDQPPPPPPPGARRFGPDGHGFRGGGFRGPRSTPEERAKRRAELFGRMDANKDGQVTFDEYRAFIEAQRLERQRRAFERFSGGQSAVTLDQLNARALEREQAMRKRFEERRGRRGPGPGPAPAPAPAPAPPASGSR